MNTPLNNAQNALGTVIQHSSNIKMITDAFESYFEERKKSFPSKMTANLHFHSKQKHLLLFAIANISNEGSKYLPNFGRWLSAAGVDGVDGVFDAADADANVDTDDFLSALLLLEL